MKNTRRSTSVQHPVSFIQTLHRVEPGQVRNVPYACKNYRFSQYCLRVHQFRFRSYQADATIIMVSLGLLQHATAGQCQVCSVLQVYRQTTRIYRKCINKQLKYIEYILTKVHRIYRMKRQSSLTF